MSFGTRVVLGLVAGLAVGALLSAASSPSLGGLVALLEPVGQIWLSALRMTVIPLIVAMLITGVASAAETAATGRIAARALILFVVLLTAAAVLSAILTPVVLTWWPVDAQTAAAFRVGVSHDATAIPQLPPLREWFTQIIPVNPFAAAAEGALLPLVIFSLFFGFAASRIAPTLRAPLLGFFQAVMDTMLVIVRWILWVAPIGVFALALVVGARGGLGAAGAITHYLILMCSLGVLITLLMYPTVALAARVPLALFAKAVAPAQAVAVSTQSSLASLPAMLTAAQSQLGLPERATAMTLPLAVSLFRITSPLFNLAIVVFVAHVYGVHLDAARLTIGVVLAVVTSFGVVGLPSQLTFFNTTVPISVGMGVPLELLPLLLAVEVIPDIFRTLGNVTADIAVTAIVARRPRPKTSDMDPPG